MNGKTYKNWTFSTERGMVRITGYGTAGTFDNEAAAIAFIDANTP